MKLKNSIDSYDVKSLRGIENGVKEMTKRCDSLMDLCYFLEEKIREAREDGFEDVNTDRAEAEIKKFIEKMRMAESEYSELSVSVKYYIEKMDFAALNEFTEGYIEKLFG